jgi:hypothetical protein
MRINESPPEDAWDMLRALSSSEAASSDIDILNDETATSVGRSLSTGSGMSFRLPRMGSGDSFERVLLTRMDTGDSIGSIERMLSEETVTETRPPSRSLDDDPTPLVHVSNHSSDDGDDDNLDSETYVIFHIFIELLCCADLIITQPS